MAHECEYCGQQCSCDGADTEVAQPDDCVHFRSRADCVMFDDDGDDCGEAVSAPAAQEATR